MTTAKRVLLFGASGFIGRAVSTVLQRDPRVGVLIRVARRAPEPAGDGWVSHDLVTGAADQLAGVVRRARPDAVINCSGRLAGGAVDLVEANVLVTARLLDAVSVGSPSARVVVLGSAAEYGVVPFGRPVAEDDPTNPVSDYGVTKLASTQLVRAAASAGRVDAVSLRVFNPIGPGVPAESLLGRAADRLRAALERGEDHILLGPLGGYRDFVDVRDVAAAICAAALTDEVKERVLNVGSGVPVLARTAVELLAEVAGFSGRILESEDPPGRSSAVDWIAADLGMVHRCLGWAPAQDWGASVEACWER